MIAFDIDGCVNNIKEDLILYGKRFFYDAVPDINGYYLKEIFSGYDQQLYDEFWENYGYTIYTNPPKNDFVDFIGYIKKNNIPACYITSRNRNRLFNDICLEQITLDWLKQYNINLPVFFTNDKLATVKENGVTIMIEDKLSNIKLLQSDIKLIIYSHTYNNSIDGLRVSSWSEVYKYL